MGTVVSKFLLPFALSTTFAAVCLAQPVHLDTADTHIIVVRPIDTWSGHRTTSQYTLDGFREKKVAFIYYASNGEKIIGSSGLFRKAPQTAVVQGVQTGLERHGFTNNGPSGMLFTVDRPIEVSPDKMADFTNLQNALYAEYVIAQGDPSTLSDRITAKRFVNAGLALAAYNFGMDKLGPTSGAQFVFSTGITEDIAKLTLQERKGLAAVPAPAFDYSGYKSVQVRKVSFGSDRVGQIIIAYKGDRTDEAENSGLAEAIVAASGADTTVEAVESARNDDYRHRLEIWSACVAKGACPQN